MSTTPSTPPASHNWYAIHTLSGHESGVSEALRKSAAAAGLDHRIGRILIPTEEVTETRGGMAVTRTRNTFPGMIFVEMELNDELFNLVKSIPKVTGFVGGSKPAPLSQTEVESIIKSLRPVRDTGVKIRFDVGDEVRIVDGAFGGFGGTVAKVDQSRRKISVSVNVFGRLTTVELESRQVEKR